MRKSKSTRRYFGMGFCRNMHQVFELLLLDKGPLAMHESQLATLSSRLVSKALGLKRGKRREGGMILDKCIGGKERKEVAR